MINSTVVLLSAETETGLRREISELQSVVKTKQEKGTHHEDGWLQGLASTLASKSFGEHRAAFLASNLEELETGLRQVQGVINNRTRREI